jgi:hypothetical protein
VQRGGVRWRVRVGRTGLQGEDVVSTSFYMVARLGVF